MILLLKPYLKPFCTNLKAQYNNVYVFDLRTTIRNYKVQERDTFQYFFCDAEVKDSLTDSFGGIPNGVSFKGLEYRDDKSAYSGNYSCKLNSERPYGMTIRMDNVKKGDGFKVSVWKRQSVDSKGTIIVSASNPEELYLSDCDVIEKHESGWEKMMIEFYIDKQLTNNELVIYLYNPDKADVWFDDLEIIRYSNLYELK